ncbi:MAG: AAA family ATPase [Anaerolineales bacterium]|nr:MAG: AAA family ATPase [Anaerolineales bacterium]
MNTIVTSKDIVTKMRNRIPGSPEKPSRPEDAKPDCPKCQGYGWHQSKQYNNHWFLCPCVEDKKKGIQEIGNRFDPATIGLKAIELDLTWAHVKPGISDGTKAVDIVRPYYGRGFGLVYLWGAYGQAKTLIGKILIATAYRDGKKAAYANVSSVLDDIRLAYDEQEHKTTELLRRMKWWMEREVLFLDEIDKSHDTSWVKERLHQLIDERYAKAVRGEALTVIASNKSDEALDGYMKSRLHDRRIGKVVFLNGKDGRHVMPDGYKY